MHKPLLVIFLLLICSNSYSQYKDTIYGDIKSIREKVIFLTEKENPKLLYNDDDYGHSGFRGPESTIARFHKTWFTTNYCYFINYKRNFNKAGKVIEDIWYDKDDSLYTYYKYKRDTKNRIIQKIDSIYGSVYTATHYYKGEWHESIITQNSDLDYFRHEYKRYNEKRELIRYKLFNDSGNVKEYNYSYNDAGKLLYREYSSRYNWNQLGENRWGYGINDSVWNSYKDLVNVYDKSNHLIKSEKFSLYADKNHKKPIRTEYAYYDYDGDRLIKETKGYNTGKPYTTINLYDNLGQIIESRHFIEGLSEPLRTRRYSYINATIKSLVYSESAKASAESKATSYDVTYDYKYDDKGNWIEIVKTVDGIKLYKWVRSFEYYK